MAAAIAAAGGRAVPVPADMSRLADVRRLFAETLEAFGRVDILVANAGVSIHAPLVEASEEAFDATFSLNARGTFFCLQEAARHVEDGGRIVSISSSATQGAAPTTSFYAGSKAAAEQFVRVLAHELGPRQVTVNTVSPASPTPTCPPRARFGRSARRCPPSAGWGSLPTSPMSSCSW